MALLIYWYDFICFGIVVAAYVGSLWVLWRKELATRRESNTFYDSLLVVRSDIDGFVDALPSSQVGSSQLWITCWTSVSPIWLLLTRFTSLLIMAVLLTLDIMDWGPSVFIYYTECVVYMSSSEGNGIEYWLRWQVPVCALIFLGPALFALYAVKNLKAEPVYLNDLWRPRWRCLNPVWLLLYRLVAFICMTPMLYETVAIDGAFAFYFYTQWTFTLVMVYFALGTVISTYGCFLSPSQPSFENGVTERVEDIGILSSITYGAKETRGTVKLQSHYAEEAFRQRAGFWGYLMQSIYQASAGAVILTDLVFWCIIVPFGSNEHLQLDLLMGSMHTLNAVFLLIDTALNDLPFPWFRIAYFVQWSCFYVVFQWVIHAYGFTWWPYPFLELDIPWAPLWYFVLAIAHIPCYGLYVMIVNAKNSIFPKLFPYAFLRISGLHTFIEEATPFLFKHHVQVNLLKSLTIIKR